MTNPEEILSDLALGEDQRHEFKRMVDNPESVAGEVVAFANSDGGVLYLGVDDGGQLIGLGDPERAFQTLTPICRDRCIPPISPIIEQFRVTDKEIIVLQIRPELNRQKPYRTTGGRFYIRVGRDKKDATGRELIRIAQAAGELYYDESPVLGTSLADLSIATFSAYHQHHFGLGTGVPRLIIRLSRVLSGREPEFALVGEELRMRIWARPWSERV